MSNEHTRRACSAQAAVPRQAHIHQVWAAPQQTQQPAPVALPQNPSLDSPAVHALPSLPAFSCNCHQWTSKSFRFSPPLTPLTSEWVLLTVGVSPVLNIPCWGSTLLPRRDDTQLELCRQTAQHLALPHHPAPVSDLRWIQQHKTLLLTSPVTSLLCQHRVSHNYFDIYFPSSHSVSFLLKTKQKAHDLHLYEVLTETTTCRSDR